MNRIARINLTTGEVKSEVVAPHLREAFLGGRGLNIYFLYTMTDANTDQLGPENVLVIGPGLLTGTLAVSAGRTNISAKSPETGYLGDGNMGGHFGTELRRAGFDHLIFTGRSPRPVYLWVHDGDVELRDATHLAALDTFDTQDRIKEELRDAAIQIACIGPAGRNLVRMASVVHGYGGDAVGRTGMGAAMGTKNLWAVAARGTGTLPVADMPTLRDAFDRHYRQVTETKGFQATATYGTLIRLNNTRMMGLEGGHNYQTNMVDSGEELDADVFVQRYEIGKKACFNCPVHCKHVWEIREGRLAGTRGIGMEYFGAGGWGSQCGAAHWETILEAFTLCNRYGLDVSSSSGYTAWLMELYQRGIVTKEQTGGLALEWGDSAAVTGLLHQMATGEGLGKLLAQGWQAAAAAIGGDAARYMQHVKGLSMEPDDVRGHKAKLLGMVTATRGADHLRSRYTIEEFYLPAEHIAKVLGRPVPPDPDSYEGKAWATFWTENLCAAADALGICKFVTKWLSPGLLGFAEMAESASAVTGMSISPQQLSESGERMYNLERLFLVRLGLGRGDDRVPDRLREPWPRGPRRGTHIEEEKFQRMLGEYYDIHGWDQNGVPRRETLARLGLDRLIALPPEVV